MTATSESKVLIAEMAIRSGVTPSFLRVLAERGAVPAAKAGRYWMFDLADIELIRQAATAAGRPPIVVAAPSPA
ncbi:hypothetical protein J0H58_28260 [bacterium]|nr:hypothetical protein [bacterium]